MGRLSTEYDHVRRHRRSQRGIFEHQVPGSRCKDEQEPALLFKRQIESIGWAPRLSKPGPSRPKQKAPDSAVEYLRTVSFNGLRQMDTACSIWSTRLADQWRRNFSCLLAHAAQTTSRSNHRPGGERLYAEFIMEASRRLLDACKHLAVVAPLYASVGRMRLSGAVIRAAEQVTSIVLRAFADP